MPPFASLVAALQHRARQQPDAEAFVFLDRQGGRQALTWARLHTLAGRFAQRLRGGGLARGGLVVIALVNSPERLVGECGVWLSGAASVNGQSLLADGSDVLRTLRVSRARAVLVDPDDVADGPWGVLRSRVTLGDADDDVGNVTSSDSLPDLKKVYFVRRVEGRGRGDFLGRLDALAEGFQADDVTPDDVLCALTTSGTTGFSKLVVHTHYNFIKVIEREGDVAVSSNSSQSKELNLAPFGWIAGFPAFTVLQGGTRVMCDVRAGGLPEDVEEFIWRSVQQEKCSSAMFPPMYLPRLTELAEADQEKKKKSESESESKDGASGPDASPARKLNVVFLSGLPVTRAMVRASLVLAHCVIVAYGATDFMAVSFMVLVAGGSESYVDHDSGTLSKGVEVKIVSQDDEGETLPANQQGAILVKGPCMMRGYLNDPRATAQAFTDDGFFRTGDVGRVDERGHVIVEGRGSDAVMRGAYIFYPSWLETRIAACPGVRDVFVVGVPDPYVNEEICACVVLDSDGVTTEQVRQFVEADIVAAEKDPLSPRPRYYLRFESLPWTTTGKPRRKAIKAEAAERLNLSPSC